MHWPTFCYAILSMYGGDKGDRYALKNQKCTKFSFQVISWLIRYLVRSEIGMQFCTHGPGHIIANLYYH